MAGRRAAMVRLRNMFRPSILVRGAGQKSLQLSNVQDNQAAYNDPVPLIYGTQWHKPDVVFSRNDGNLTRMEVLLCMGQIQGVLTVLVDDIVVPQGVNGQNMTSTGWWNLISPWGARNGHCRIRISGMRRQRDWLAILTGAWRTFLSVVVPKRES